MNETHIDARGLPCPQPVIKTREAILTPGLEAVRIVVDDPGQVENIVAMARNEGWDGKIDRQDGEDIEILVVKGEQPAGQAAAGEGQACGVPTRVVVFVASDRFGQGDDELGAILMRGFIKTLREVVPQPVTMIFANAGVKLTTTGSVLLNDLRLLEQSGIQMLSCGTCLDFFGLKDKLEIGRISNMYEIATALVSADRVVRS